MNLTKNHFDKLHITFCGFALVLMAHRCCYTLPLLLILKKNMTPKEKAEELLDKYDESLTYLESKSKAKQCALIAVDEIINHHSQEQGLYRIDTYYWQQVKSELQSL